LKVLPRYYATDPNFVRRFKQEAKIIASLEHPNILTVHDFGEQARFPLRPVAVTGFSHI
jgi:serine/threonine protein kinase